MSEYKKIVEKVKPELEKAINFFKSELAKIHAGRTTPALVEDIMVDCFGEKLPLKQLAAISVPEPRKIVIQPWDDSYSDGIINALLKADIGGSPVAEKDLIRVNFPTLSQEYREKIVRNLANKKEETRVTIKKWREEIWKEIQEKFKEKEITEDDKFKAKDELQEIVDEYNKKVDELAGNKKEEIMNN